MTSSQSEVATTSKLLSSIIKDTSAVQQFHQPQEVVTGFLAPVSSHSQFSLRARQRGKFVEYIDLPGYTMLKISSPTSNSQTVTIRPSIQPKIKSQQQIIVIPQSMLVNGCISAKDLKTIIDNNDSKNMETKSSLKRSLPESVCSDYGSDSEEGSSDSLDNKPPRKRANLDHLSPEEKLMRRKLKNRVAAQNARDKKRVKMEEMDGELQRLKVNT